MKRDGKDCRIVESGGSVASAMKQQAHGDRAFRDWDANRGVTAPPPIRNALPCESDIPYAGLFRPYGSDRRDRDFVPGNPSHAPSWNCTRQEMVATCRHELDVAVKPW